jgi:hypothetical protein
MTRFLKDINYPFETIIRTIKFCVDSIKPYVGGALYKTAPNILGLLQLVLLQQMALL